ncbi:DUF445 domain-containing protein [Sphingosinithalassobacter tenebrarum]|uniref:DUF445 domain-containing protein n=2 Tax=Stakelama tenebrarum TaxID=2711215 RepID=A0A6G6YAM5_9SPHN|nr:DUF445 domain-containing protein [Sphingosinithalassobacter tenebrarum]
MRWIATLMLVVMATTFILASRYEDVHPAIGFLRAFAEAAMVGGLADWFAVTALFRHPLGLPIPHTAIIPRNKDRIGDTLACFLRDNFLTPGVVARRMHRIDVAGAAGRWLTDPRGSRGRVQQGAARLLADALEALDQDRLGGMAKRAIGGQLRTMKISAPLGRVLDSAIAEDRHIPLLDGIIRWAARVLDANEHLIRDMVHQRAGSILRWTGLDERLANAIIDGLAKLIVEMAEDPHHPLRAKAEEGLAKLAADLQFDPVTQERVEAFKIEMLDNPALDRWWMGIWESARAGLLRFARDPEAAFKGELGEALRQLGETLQREPALAATVNRFVRRTAVGVANDYGDAIVRLVSDTVRGWDAETITGRMENAVGRDLQFIRINGTLVGGMVGVAIHAVSAVL